MVAEGRSSSVNMQRGCPEWCGGCGPAAACRRAVTAGGRGTSAVVAGNRRCSALVAGNLLQQRGGGGRAAAC